MVLAKAVLIPLSLALLISFILYPVVKKLESWGFNKLLAAFLSLLMVFVILGGAITLFSAEIMSLSEELDNFTEKIMNTFSDVIFYINGNVNFIEDLDKDELVQNGKKWIEESAGSLLKNTFSSTTSFLTGLLTTTIFTFLFLIYSKGLTNAFVAFGDDENKGKIFNMLKKIQSVGKKYLTGMFLLILILGFANSIGLWIIGIDSPFLFGFLAATLSIVPFVGTTIGATIPTLYAFMAFDSLWMPAAVIILFWGIQVIESNFLSPKIVGSNLNVNALLSILSLLIGAVVWGVAGMILFLPFTAILKVVCEEFDQLKPIALIIGDDISDDSNQPKKWKWVEKVKGWFNKMKG